MNHDFREPATRDELQQLFEFRRQIYAESNSLKAMTQQPDISVFDCRAFHFAAFLDGAPIAYIRMVQRENTAFAGWVKSIAGKSPEPISNQITFPFEQYSPHREWNKSFLQSQELKKVGEAGKLAIHKKYRSDEMLENFIRSFMHHCIHQNQFDTGFGVCSLVLERFYKRLGFYRPDGARSFVYKTLPEAVILQFDAKTNPARSKAG